MEIQEIIALTIEHATMESTRGTCCRMANGRIMEYGV